MTAGEDRFKDGKRKARFLKSLTTCLKPKKYKKKCQYIGCSREFETNSKVQNYCSRQCSGLAVSGQIKLFTVPAKDIEGCSKP